MQLLLLLHSFVSSKGNGKVENTDGLTKTNFPFASGNSICLVLSRLARKSTSLGRIMHQRTASEYSQINISLRREESYLNSVVLHTFSTRFRREQERCCLASVTTCIYILHTTHSLSMCQANNTNTAIVHVEAMQFIYSVTLLTANSVIKIQEASSRMDRTLYIQEDARASLAKVVANNKHVGWLIRNPNSCELLGVDRISPAPLFEQVWILSKFLSVDMRLPQT